MVFEMKLNLKYRSEKIKTKKIETWITKTLKESEE